MDGFYSVQERVQLSEVKIVKMLNQKEIKRSCKTRNQPLNESALGRFAFGNDNSLKDEFATGLKNNCFILCVDDFHYISQMISNPDF